MYVPQLTWRKLFSIPGPIVARFPEIEEKYRRKIRIYSMREEEYSADVKVADIMKESDLKTYRQHMQIR